MEPIKALPEPELPPPNMFTTHDGCMGEVQVSSYRPGTVQFLHEAWRSYAKASLAAYGAAAPLCEKHQPSGGTRAVCVICAMERMSAALSRISYACQPPNEMKCSDYDVHCNESAVVEQVRASLATQRDRVIEECAELLESQHTWITSIAASALIRALKETPWQQATPKSIENKDLAVQYQLQQATPMNPTPIEPDSVDPASALRQSTLIAWGEKRPPVSHWIMSSYSVMEKPRLSLFCKRGCCIDQGFGPMVLPLYWRDATPDEIAACDWRDGSKQVI